MSDKNYLKFKGKPIMRDYLNIFPDDLLGLPLESEMEFTIELLQRTTPISKAYGT